MPTLTKRATIYLDPEVHKILRIKALETGQTISGTVNDALLSQFAEDEEDLASFVVRGEEPTIRHEELCKKLKTSGRV